MFFLFEKSGEHNETNNPEGINTNVHIQKMNVARIPETTDWYICILSQLILV